ncbi:MAG: hypothetical protein WAT52_12715 [Chitinophagales bacterium]
MKNIYFNRCCKLWDNSYPYLLTTILFFTMNSIVWGQCAATGSGTCTAATNVTGTVTWSGYYCVVSDIINIQNEMSVIDVSSFSTGMYIITVLDDNSIKLTDKLFIIK